MKKHFFITLVALCVFSLAKANVLTHTFRFNESDFLISATETDSLSISSIKETAIYPDPTDPWIPTLGKNIALSANETVKNTTYTLSKRLIRSGVDLKNAPMAIPTNVNPDDIVPPPGGYDSKIYPASNCTLSKCYKIGGTNVASFLVTPYVFDAENRNLYFVDSLQVNMEIETSLARNAITGTTPNQIELLETIVENTAALKDLPIEIIDYVPYERVEYLIITCDSLKESFQPLADWKRKKGVPSKIVTIEEVEQNYSGRTQQIKIKSCIKDYSENYGAFYVLLGGDVNIIPVQKCYVYVSSSANDSIPADIYYSCLEDLDWDTNGNGKAGELSDSVNIVPNIQVTRIPVKNTTQTRVIANRIIEYEQAPYFRTGLLQVGYTLSEQLNAEALADKLFNEIINGKIRMEVTKCFDSYSEPVKDVTIEGLSDELNRGHQFIEILSHGSQIGFGYKGHYFFNRELAYLMNNVGQSFITTMACDTNAFDRSLDPCISEILMRNENCGIVGYFGSSRSGWFTDSSTPLLTYSLSYEKDFYERLLNTETQMPLTKFFGTLVNFVKHTHLCFVDYNPVYRWLHFAVNPLGDPETPIYNGNPLYNMSATAECNGGTLVIDAGVDGAKVCISSAGTGFFYEITNEKVSTHQPGFGTYDIWITKQNYIPKHFQVQVGIDATLQPLETQILSMTPNPATNYITVKYQCMLVDANLKLMLTKTNGLGIYEFVLDSMQSEETLDISNIPSGVYVVNMVENGNILPSYSSRLVIE